MKKIVGNYIVLKTEIKLFWWFFKAFMFALASFLFCPLVLFIGPSYINGAIAVLERYLYVDLPGIFTNCLEELREAQLISDSEYSKCKEMVSEMIREILND